MAGLEGSFILVRYRTGSGTNGRSLIGKREEKFPYFNSLECWIQIILNYH